MKVAVRIKAAVLFFLALVFSLLLVIGHTRKQQLMPACEEPFAPLEQTTLFIATDLHYLEPELTDGGTYFQQVIQNADGKMTDYSQELLDAFVWQVVKESPDALILSGDLTFNGEALSHQRLAAKLQEIEKAGISVLVIPGNHDLENPMAAQFVGDGYDLTESVTAEQFSWIYRDFGYDEALARDNASLSYVAELAPNLRVLMVDSNTMAAPGTVTSQTLSWIEEQLQDAADCGAWVVAVSHQNVLAHNSLLTAGYVMENASQLLSLYEQYPVICNLSGHIHLQHIAASKEGFPEIVTSSLAVHPNQYGVLRLEGAAADYHTEPVGVAAWAREQNRQDLGLQNFPQTARSFFWDTGYRQAMQALQDDAEKEMLAAFFAEVNTAYFAGRMDTVQWDDALFDAWQARGSFLSLYLSSIADGGFQKQTVWNGSLGG